ncbi:MAG: discoidin domain-containing protein [Alphaproteobacteria bacterium]|nr:discoidin domain-containing protein [Alphaproteobacteria bacterium]
MLIHNGAYRSIIVSAFAPTCICLVLVGVYAPAAIFEFGYHNDFWAWAYETRYCCTGHPETAESIRIGRPLAAFARNLQFLSLTTFEDLRLWRVIIVATMALNAIYFWWLVRRFGTGRLPPGSATLLVFLHSTMQLNSLWASNFVYFNPPICLALAASHAYLAGAVSRSIWRTSVLVVSLLTGALFFYSPSATFFIVPVVYVSLSRVDMSARQLIRLFSGAAILLAVAYGMYAGVHRVFVFPLTDGRTPVGSYEWAITDRLVATAIERLFLYYLPASAQPWTNFEGNMAAGAFVSICALGVGAALRRVWCSGRASFGPIVSALGICVLISLALLPNLVAGRHATTVRVLFTTGSCTILVGLWALGQVVPWLHRRVVAGFLCASIAIVAFFGVYATASMLNRELSALRAQLDGLDRQVFRSIVILRPHVQPQFSPLSPIPGVESLPPIVHIGDAVFGRRIRSEADFDLLMLTPSHGKRFDLFVEPSGAFVDLRSFMAAYNASVSDDPIQISGTVQASVRPANSGPVAALDGVAESFWEVWGVALPISLTVSFNDARQVGRYWLISGPHLAAARMPLKWEFWGGPDVVSMTLLDSQTAEPWHDSERRQFVLGSPVDVKVVRLNVLAIEHPGELTGVRVYELEFGQ